MRGSRTTSPFFLERRVGWFLLAEEEPLPGLEPGPSLAMEDLERARLGGVVVRGRHCWVGRGGGRVKRRVVRALREGRKVLVDMVIVVKRG